MRHILHPIIISILLLAGCASNRVTDFQPDSEDHQAVIFGTVKVYYDRQDVTPDAVVVFQNADRLALERDGFAAAHAPPSAMAGIKEVRLTSNGASYPLTDMTLMTGKAGTRTYFGHVMVRITPRRVAGEDVDATWSWSAENRWPEAWARWSRSYGKEARKFFVGVPARAAPAKRAERELATEKPEAAVGP